MALRVLTSILVLLGLGFTAKCNRSIVIEGDETSLEARNAYLRKAAKVFSFVFLVVTLMLATSIVTLLWTLHIKFNVNRYRHFNNNFAKEIFVIAAILCTFCASYVIRVFVDFYFSEHDP